MRRFPACVGLNPRAFVGLYRPMVWLPTTVPKASAAAVTAFSLARCARAATEARIAEAASTNTPRGSLRNPGQLRLLETRGEPGDLFMELRKEPRYQAIGPELKFRRELGRFLCATGSD